MPPRHIAIARTREASSSPATAISTRSSTVNPASVISLTVMPNSGMRCMFDATSCRCTAGSAASRRARGIRSPQSARVVVTMQIRFSIDCKSTDFRREIQYCVCAAGKTLCGHGGERTLIYLRGLAYWHFLLNFARTNYPDDFKENRRKSYLQGQTPCR